MKYLTAAFVIGLFIPITGIAQITITAPEKSRTEVLAPMEVTIPLEEPLVPHPESRAALLFKTEALSTTVCEAVTLKSIRAHVSFNVKRTKGVLTFFVFTYTEPPQDKMAFVTFRVRNDDEILSMPTSEFPRRTDLTLKINAEEKKSRSKSKKANIDPEQLDRILAGKNPRVEIILNVKNNRSRPLLMCRPWPGVGSNSAHHS
jgi:hypothetical protein